VHQEGLQPAAMPDFGSTDALAILWANHNREPVIEAFRMDFGVLVRVDDAEDLGDHVCEIHMWFDWAGDCDRYRWN
jgi:hypothetical protein